MMMLLLHAEPAEDKGDVDATEDSHEGDDRGGIMPVAGDDADGVHGGDIGAKEGDNGADDGLSNIASAVLRLFLRRLLWAISDEEFEKADDVDIVDAVDEGDGNGEERLFRYERRFFRSYSCCCCCTC